MEETIRTISTGSGRELRADLEFDYSTRQAGCMVRLADVTTVPGWETWLTPAEAMQLAELLAELACTAALRNGEDAAVVHVCHRCGFPVTKDEAGGWVHSETADAGFCVAIYGAGT